MAKPRETNLWSVWSGKKEAPTEAYDLGERTTSVLWPEVPDLGTFATKQALRAKLDQVYPGHKGNSNALGSLWAFIHNVSIEDYVVMPMRKKSKEPAQFCIGVVKGVYRYSAERDQSAFHYRRVTWQYKYMPRAILDADLRKRIAGRATVTPIYTERGAERILAACEAYTDKMRVTPKSDR